MPQIVNRKKVASHCDVSLPTVDAWVRKGCPYVTRGSKGVEWEFDLDAVKAWLARFWSRPTQIVTRTGMQTFTSTEQAEVVKALGHVVRHVGRVTAEMAVKAGATIPIAYVLNQMVCIRASGVAEAYLAEHGVQSIDLVETFCRLEDEPDWQVLAKDAGETFNEDACERYQKGITWFQPSPEVLEAQAARLKARGND